MRKRAKVKREAERAAKAILKAWAACELRPVPSVPDWATAHRVLPGEVTAKPGPFRFDLTPWMREPSEALDDPSVSELVLCMAARLGKTELLMNLYGRTIQADPRNILIVYPDLDKAKKWDALFFQPMVDTTPAFRGLLSNRTAKDGRNTALRKKFPGGHCVVVGAHAPSAFRQIQAPVITCDEVDAYETTKEGDPVDLAFRRAENYPDAIKVVASTPTDEGTSRIWSWLEKSDCRKWHVQSPKTGNWFVLDWEHLKWDEDKPHTARIHDPDTGEAWTEAERRAAILGGKWIATRPQSGIRGYWLDGLVSLFPASKGHVSKCHQFAADFLKARDKGIESLKAWTNLFRAIPWRAPAEVMDWEAVRDARVEDYEHEIPERVLMVTGAADVQSDRIELEFVGWGEDFESWGLGYHILTGDTKRPEVWQKLEDVLRREFTHASGAKIPLARFLIDEGHNPQHVRKFALRMMQSGLEVQPCKGIGRNGVIEPELVQFNAQKKQKGIRSPTWNIGTSRAKRTIYAHVLADAPGPHTMHFPEGRGYSDRYFQGLVAERVVTKHSFGQPYKVFELPSGARNEPLDVRVYAYAAAVSLNPMWEGLRKRLGPARKPEPPPPQQPPATEPAPKPEPPPPPAPVSTNQIRAPRPESLTAPRAQPTQAGRRIAPARGSSWATRY